MFVPYVCIFFFYCQILRVKEYPNHHKLLLVNNEKKDYCKLFKKLVDMLSVCVCACVFLPCSIFSLVN